MNATILDHTTLETLNKMRNNSISFITKITFDIESFENNCYPENDIRDLKELRTGEMHTLQMIDILIEKEKNNLITELKLSHEKIIGEQ